MRRLLLLPILSSPIFFGGFSFINSSEPIAVIELFTSQGCSSCPSADKLLATIVNDSEGNQIFGLSFHVSYWNRLGWKDPYSSEAFTNRQRKYAAVMNLQTIYTPQMVVNGKFEFVGSSKSKVDYYVKRVLSEPSDISIALDNLNTKNNQLYVEYTLNKKSDGHFLNFALIEKHVENYVPRGENNGLTLKHENVVRTFKTIYANQSGTIEIDIDNSINFKDCLLIAYLQDKNNLQIYGASKIGLENIN